MIKRVFISHTSEFTKYPNGKSFIDAAIAAVNRAGHVPCNMGYFTARDQKPAEYCKERVRECDVYVGVIGFRYGSQVRDRGEVSYTEIEFEAASEDPPKPRLVFILDPMATVPVGEFGDQQFWDRQSIFRKRLQDPGLMHKFFRDVHELEMLIHQALLGSIPSKVETPQPETIGWPDGKSPYPGLEWFDDAYAPLFFGRDREVNDLIAKMGEPQGRFLLISGASGSGKSSLVAAGLWHAVLKEGRLPGSTKWVWLRITPGDGSGPFESLAWGLKQTFPRISHKPGELADELAGHPSTLKTLLASHLTSDQELLLFVDQLEELFTQGFKEEEIQHFLEHLVATSRDTQNRLWVVTTVRSEFIGKLEESTSVLEVLNAGYNYHLGPVSTRILQKMIEQPAQATSYEFESHLVDEILDEAGKEPGNLPLVAYTLKQLFEGRQERTFTREAYKTMGGVAGAIGTKADQVMETLGTDTMASFDKVFAELVHLERDRPPTRKRVPLTVFKDDAAGVTTLIQALASSHCRVLVTGEEGKDATVEVAHEKLFTVWPKLKTWIDDGGESLRLIDYAEEAAKRWHETGRHLQELWLSRRAEEIQKALNRFSKNASAMLERMLRPQQMLIARLEDDSLSHEDRLLIGKKLAEFGDPRPGVGLREDGLPDIEWIEIPPGRIQLENVEHVFEIKPFRLAKYPVTNVQFKAFIKAEDGYQNKEWWQGLEQREGLVPSSGGEANCPRETVSWYETVAFCRWFSDRTGTHIRLPTEWEWQQAATGGDPTYMYPWPGEWDAARCSCDESRLKRTSPVGIYPSGATQQGVMDMAGNVWEQCLNTYENPEMPESMHLDASAGQRVIRGGSWLDEPDCLRSSFRSGCRPGGRGTSIGFRLAQDIP